MKHYEDGIIVKIIRCLIIVFVSIILFISGNLAIAEILEVGPSGYDYTFIQEAIDTAVNGDEVLVHEGIYKELIDFKGKAIVIRAAKGPDQTIIDGCLIDPVVKSDRYSVVKFDQSEESGSILNGFTIQTGSYEITDGVFCGIHTSPIITNCIISTGIYCEVYSSPTINNCLINKNAAAKGGGIFCDMQSSPAIFNCIISENNASSDGGGIYCENNSFPTISNCLISKNAAAKGGGIFCDLYSSPLVINCIVCENEASSDGGGIFCISSSPTFINCTFSQNVSSGKGGGIFYSDPSYWPYSPKIINSILWGDKADGDFNEIDKNNNPVSITYSNILLTSGVYPGKGNINADPLFMNSKQGNYYLKPGSPCIDKGTTYNAPEKDKIDIIRPQGLGVDMGAYEYVDPNSCTPRAIFAVDKMTGDTYLLTVLFDASYSGGSQYNGVDFSWDFGDGSSGSGMKVSHFYTDSYLHSGSYDVSLTIATECGSHSFSLTLNDIPGILHVSEEGINGWPYTSIQDAIDDAQDGEIILVHDGTYFENIDFKGKSITVRSENGAHSTIIDGNGSGSVVTFDNSEGIDTVLDGFTIQNGLASKGGGIYCKNSSPIITACNINNNKAGLDDPYWYYNYNGGGISCETRSSPKIDHCTINSNTAENDGGGIFCRDSSPEMTHCIISCNSAKNNGGGIYCFDSDLLRITNCTITGNTAEDDGGGIFCQDSTPEMTHCIISGNTTEDDGGGMYCENSSPKVVHCTIENNIASWWGGGIYCENYSSPIMTSCTVSENTSLSGDGGGIYCFYHSSPEIADCKIIDNKAYMDGGGIYCNSHSSPKLTNCTISVNSASVGNGSGLFFENSSPKVVNNILWGNMAGRNPDQIFLGSNVDYSSLKFLNSGTDERISIPVYNKRAGRWKACYRFFGKTCGENLPIQSCNILFIFSLR